MRTAHQTMATGQFQQDLNQVLTEIVTELVMEDMESKCLEKISDHLANPETRDKILAGLSQLAQTLDDIDNGQCEVPEPQIELVMSPKVASFIHEAIHLALLSVQGDTKQ